MVERLFIIGLFAVALVASTVLGDDRAKSGVSQRDTARRRTAKPSMNTR